MALMKKMETCPSLTTEVNGLLTPAHPQISVIVNPVVYGLWLNEDVSQQGLCKSLLPSYL
jgi:putative SOS response-associated peptidase YedK